MKDNRYLAIKDYVDYKCRCSYWPKWMSRPKMRRYLTKAVTMRLDGKTYREIGEATGRCGQRIRQVFDQFNRYYKRWEKRYEIHSS